MTASLPAWANEMCDLFKSGSVSQFILHGNVFDVIPGDSGPKPREYSLNEYLGEVLFAGYDATHSGEQILL